MTEDMKKDSLPVEEETVETVEPVETAAEKPAVLVRDVMEKVFVSVTPDTPIRDVFRLFIKHRLLAVPVVDENSHLIGLISSADLMYRSSKPHIPRLPFMLRRGECPELFQFLAETVQLTPFLSHG